MSLSKSHRRRAVKSVQRAGTHGAEESDYEKWEGRIWGLHEAPEKPDAALEVIDARLLPAKGRETIIFIPANRAGWATLQELDIRVDAGMKNPG